MNRAAVGSLLSLALTVSPLRAQLVADGATATLSNVTNNISGDDTAATTLPNTTMIASGIYRPTDFDPGETLPSPAPAGPYSTTLSSFNGSSPNGVWSLYLVNDDCSCCGMLIGWSVQITKDDGPFLDPPMFELNGGMLVTRGAVINNDLPFVVGGPGGVPAVWEARAGLSENTISRDLLVGNNSSFNQLLIPSGVVSVGANVIVGASPSVSTNHLLHVTGGTLRVLTPGAALDVRGGTNRLDAGLVDLNRLVITNARGQFEFNGGTLRTPDTTVANGRIFTVGNGASAATLQLLGGTHAFANNLTVASNGSLIGNGVIDGTVTISAGGRLVPGAPIGRIDVLGSVILQGTVNLQIDKSGGVRTSDEVIADGAIFYNGTLNVTDIGTDLLSAGDRFFLFDATPYVGAFTTLNLPPLGAGLAWRNNLSVDGSIEVIAAGSPGFASISRSGTNVIFTGTDGVPGANYAVLTATNVAAPLSNSVSLVTNQFGAGGAFSFTNGIAPGERQRYFRLRTP